MSLFQVKKFKLKISRNYLYLLLGISVFAGSLWFFLTYGSELFQFIPGYYANNQYNEITSSKSEFILENSEYFSSLDEIEVQVALLGINSEDLIKKKQFGEQSLEYLRSIESNIQEIIELDSQMMELQLPPSILRYVEMVEDYDEARLLTVRKKIELIEARNLQYEFDIYRATFDNCLESINFSAEDAEIYSGLTSCNLNLEDLNSQIELMEQESGVTLDLLDYYIQELQNQWLANANFYKAISENDYDASQQYDDTFAESRRKINEMDLDLVLSEFNDVYTSTVLEEFDELTEQENELLDLATSWYEDKLTD